MIVDERITAYINSLETELPLHLKELEKSALSEGVPIIRKETQTFIRLLLAIKQPVRILEVGAAVGFSALYMGEYMPENCTLTTIEKVEMRLVKARVNIASAPKGHKITLLEGDALNVLKQLADKDTNSFDFIFMDAAKAQYMNFLPEIMKLLTMGGLLITDNVLQDGTVVQSRYSITRRDRTIHSRMREYLYAITHMEELETAVVPIGDGVTVSTRVK
jgi:predicted O-methyltransferase YrrM